MAKSSFPLTRYFTVSKVVWLWILIRMAGYSSLKPRSAFSRNRCSAVSVAPISTVPPLWASCLLISSWAFSRCLYAISTWE